MSFIKNIQEQLGRFCLRKEKKRLQRNVKAFGLEKASSIGVLYNATNRDDADTVKKFVQYLKEERKEVVSLGFIDTKETSEYLTSILNYTYFDQTHLKKNLVPEAKQVNSFLNQPFSILIDLNRKEDCFPLEYISTLSKAKFKVGANGAYRNEVCDMLIEIGKEDKISFLIIQVKNYLKMIRN